MKKILVIGPFSPPITGMSTMNEILIDGLGKDFIIDKCNTVEEISLGSKVEQGKFKFLKALKAFNSLFKMINKFYSNQPDIVYITPGQSFLGLVRFLPIVFIGNRNKHCKVILHFHGSKMESNFSELSYIKHVLVKYTIELSDNVIVLGSSIKESFERLKFKTDVRICKNAVKNEYCSNELIIKSKEIKSNKAENVLFLSNLMKDKGIIELLNVFISNKDIESNLFVAGAIEPSNKLEIESLIKQGGDKVRYVGIVDGDKKIELLQFADVLVLPSFDEGQPISILEGYANGCIVVTDEKIGGIKDIFEDSKNGVSCIAGDEESIHKAIEKARKLNNIVSNNYSTYLKNYSQEAFVERMLELLC